VRQSLKNKFRNGRHADLLKASALAFAVRVLGAVSGFIATLFIARVLGAEESGYYFLVLSVVSILAAVSRLGMDNTLIRFVGEDATCTCKSVAGQWRT